MRTFGDPADWPEQDLVGWSDEFDADIVVAAYREGLFPMPLYLGDFRGEMGWWSPVERGILPLESLRVTRSLRKSAKRYRVTVDEAFGAVLDGCADRKRPDGWIDGRIRAVYTGLHEAGLAHSVEVWDADGGLAGGLYGVGIGGLFAGESMFHAPSGRDASKVALVALVDLLDDGLGTPRLLDVQWTTPHLASLGALDVSREEYLELLAEAIDAPGPVWPRREEPHARDA